MSNVYKKLEEQYLETVLKREGQQYDKENGAISNYLVKYIIKGGGHIYYTRHLPTEKEMEVDLDEDVALTYVDHSTIKVLLDLGLFLSSEDLQNLGSDHWPIVDGGDMGFNLNTLLSTKRSA